MNVKCLMFALLIAPLLAGSLFAAPQEEENPKVLPKTKVAVDGEVERIEVQDEDKESVEVVQEEPIPELLGFGGGLQIRGVSSSGNGARTSVMERDLENNLVRTARIEVDKDRVNVKITRYFGPEQRNELLEALPNLTEYTESFPPTVEDLGVELSVGISKTLVADNLEQFEQKYPSVYQQYRRQLGPRQQFGVRRPRFNRVLPEMIPQVHRPAIAGALRVDAVEQLMTVKATLEKSVQLTEKQLEDLHLQLQERNEKFGTEHIESKRVAASVEFVEARLEKVRNQLIELQKRIEAGKKLQEKNAKDEQANGPGPERPKPEKTRGIDQ